MDSHLQSVNPGWTLPQILHFMELCWHLTSYLDIHRPDPSQQTLPPYELPVNVVNFLSECMFQDDAPHSMGVITQLWSTHRHSIWETRDVRREASHLVNDFLRYGPKNEIGGLLKHIYIVKVLIFLV
jgi:hypothetical protein